MFPEENGHGLRHELKYRVDPLQRESLRRRLAKVLKTDRNAGPGGGYNIRSLYFDDYADTALREKASGVYKRSKYRLRIYNRSDAVIKLERKTRVGDLGYKEDVRLSRVEVERVLAGDIGFLIVRGGLLAEFYRDCRCRLLRPVVLVEYERVAFQHPAGNVRVTLDSDLRVGLGPTQFFSPDPCTMGVVDEPDTILEVKYDDVLPQFIRGLLPEFIMHVGISKFESGRLQRGSAIGGLAGFCLGAPLGFD